ncbi:MAG: 30S ribosome-binding factor RbfA [Wolinella sp.]
MQGDSFKIERTQSLLREIIPEALASLNDSRLNSLGVVDVRCSKGKQHADVYLDAPFATQKERGEILRQLRLAEGTIRAHCLQATSWFRCPKFTFIFDDTIENTNRLDDIFKKLEKERAK